MRRLKRIVILILGLVLVMGAALPALAQGYTVRANVQDFEGGRMIWRSDTSHIWVLANNGQAFSFPAATYSRLPDNPIFGNPPSRLRPIFGMGKVWGNYQYVRNLLGWPTTQEYGVNAVVSYSNVTRVTYIQLPNSPAYLIQPNGTWSSGGSFPPPSYPPTPVPPPAAAITRFDVSPLSSTRGGVVNISWSINGVEQALIEIYDSANNALLNTYFNLPPTGDTGIVIPTAISGDARVKLVGINASWPYNYVRLVEADTTVRLNTTPDQSTHVYAAYQPYERGSMVWRSDTGTVYVFYNSGGVHAFPVASYGPLPDNPFHNPPPGLVRPINGFGRVWGYFSYVRDMLGWATANEQGYQATITYAQGIPATISLPNGSAANIFGAGA